MEIMSSIPRGLRGRASARCVPIRCACKEEFAVEHARGRTVQCPKCKATHTFADDDALFDQTHNGQQL